MCINSEESPSLISIMDVGLMPALRSCSTMSRRASVFIGLCRLNLLVVNFLFSFKQLEAHVGCPQIAAHAGEVGLFCAIPVDGIPFFSLSNSGDGNSQTCAGTGGVSTHNVHLMGIASQSQALIEIIHVFHAESLADR